MGFWSDEMFGTAGPVGTGEFDLLPSSRVLKRLRSYFVTSDIYNILLHRSGEGKTFMCQADKLY